jgi:hypothetical protein
MDTRSDLVREKPTESRYDLNTSRHENSSAVRRCDAVCCYRSDAKAGIFTFRRRLARPARLTPTPGRSIIRKASANISLRASCGSMKGIFRITTATAKAIQFWGRLPLADRRFVLSAGIGPYRYFDTTTAQESGSYSDVHGWGVVYSVRAAYYSTNRWVTQLQLNRVHVQRGPDATSVISVLAINSMRQTGPDRATGPRAG